MRKLKLEGVIIQSSYNKNQRGREGWTESLGIADVAILYRMHKQDPIVENS